MKHIELIDWLFRNCYSIEINSEKHQILWKLVDAPFNIEVLNYITLTKLETKCWRVVGTMGGLEVSDKTISGSLVYSPHDNKYWDQIVSLAIKHEMWYEDISTKKEKEMPVDEDNTFEVKNILFVDIGGYEYEIDVNNPEAEDIQTVFEAAVARLSKLQDEYNRLENIADVVPSVVTEKFDKEITAVKNLITQLNEL